jgi:hypothetical protein
VTFGHYGYCTTSGFTCAHPREPRRGSSDLRSHPVAMLLLLRKKRGEKSGHAQNLLPIRTASGQVLFRTGPLPDRSSSCHVISGQKAPLGRILRNFWLCMCRTYFRTGNVTDVTSGHVTDVTSGHVTSGSTPSNATLSVPIYY